MTDWKKIHLDDPSMWPEDIIVDLEASHDDAWGQFSRSMTCRQKASS